MTNETELMPDVIWVSSVRKVKNTAGETINLLACDDDKRDPTNKNSTEYIRADAHRVPEGNARSMTRVEICPGVFVFMTQEQMMTWAEWIRGKSMIAAAQKLNGE